MNYITKQRSAVHKTLENKSYPMTPAEIWEEAKTISPGIGIATIYRTLRTLIDAGAVAVVNIPGTAPRYERNHASDSHQHHFLCETCNKIFDIQKCPGGVESLAPEGFHIKRHILTLFGNCKACNNNPPSA